MGVINGQAISAEITNSSFLDSNADDTALGKITLANTDSASGATIDNIQQEHNAIASYTGMTANSPIDVTPTWTASELGSATDTLRDRADSITQAFQSATGHAHSGAAGDGGLITGASIQNVPLRGYVNQGTGYSGISGTSSTDVSTYLVGKTPGGSTTSTGVVTASPWNKTVIRHSDGANAGDPILDTLGNVVYGRVTESSGVWTHSYYVDLSGVETAYSLPASVNIAWYYQEIYEPLVSAPVFSEFAMIPSDNVTADIQTATTTLQGKVSLSATAPGAIASTGAAGTANASTANADHTHEGLHSIKSSGGSQILGDAIIAGSNGATVTQASSTITVDAPALSSTTPSDVNSAGSVGTGTTSARADHVHKGMHSFAKNGSTALFGDVTISGSNGTTLTQAAQNIAIDSPALASTAPADIASSASVGTGTTSARADHVHRGVASVAKSGSASLYGDVTLTGTGGTTLTQASQNIAIDSPALASTAPADIGSSASVGTGTTAARADHVHRGVASLAKNGSTALYGAVTLSAGTNVTLTQVGNDISIASTGGGSTSTVTQASELQNLGLQVLMTANSVLISLKQANGTSDPSTGTGAVTIAFRSNATGGTASYIERTVTSALNTTISSGSTAGQIDGTSYYIYVYAIDNAGTVELAWSSKLFDEGSTYNTLAEGGAGGADNYVTMYSTTARSNVAIRLLGRFYTNQTVAGTWATQPSRVELNLYQAASNIPTITRLTSGTGTYTAPVSCKYVKIQMIGGGGGGAGCGTAGAGNGSAGNPTTVTFGSYVLTAFGGNGGAFGNNGVAGGTFNIPAGPYYAWGMDGGGGGAATASTGGTFATGGGIGGSGFFGGGGASGYTATGKAGAANTGGGGGGAGNAYSASGQNGGGGSSGGYVEALMTAFQSGTSFTYAVGGPATGGTAGTSGFAGGNGAAGVILVTEYYA